MIQLQEDVLQISMPPKLRYRKIDLTAQALNKAIDAQLQPQHQAADSERERLLKQHFLDQLVRSANVSLRNHLTDTLIWFDGFLGNSQILHSQIQQH